MLPIRQTEGEMESSPLPLAVGVGFHVETGPMLEPSVFVSARCAARHRMDVVQAGWYVPVRGGEVLEFFIFNHCCPECVRVARRVVNEAEEEVMMGLRFRGEEITDSAAPILAARQYVRFAGRKGECARVNGSAAFRIPDCVAPPPGGVLLRLEQYVAEIDTADSDISLDGSVYEGSVTILLCSLEWLVEKRILRRNRRLWRPVVSDAEDGVAIVQPRTRGRCRRAAAAGAGSSGGNAGGSSSVNAF